MEAIYYNEEDKEVSIVLGYGIGNHLCLEYLHDIVNEITKLFPMPAVEALKLPFLECSRSSRRHKYMFYTEFSYDLSTWEKDKYKEIIIPNGKGRACTAYCVSSHKKGVDGWTHEDETAKQVVNRLIHD